MPLQQSEIIKTLNQIRAILLKGGVGIKKAASQFLGNAANLITEDSLTSLRWYDPDQVQRVVLFQDSQFKNTPSGSDLTRLFHISYKSRVIDEIIKKSNMLFMSFSPLLRVFLLILVFGMGGCATSQAPVTPYFEIPPEHLSKADISLYNRALEQLKNYQLENSIELWKRFLKHSPRSFRGYNNLGMALYSNDKLRLSIEAFETALALEPFDHTIKNNLKRALRFQVTILRENKDYAMAIEHLERIKKLTDLKKKEKVALKIEILQDLIYQQVKLANTLEGFEAFVAKYPDNPKNADEARRLILKMKPQDTSLRALPDMLSERMPDPVKNTSSSRQAVVPPEPMQNVPPSPAIRSETIEIVEEIKQSNELEEFSEGTHESIIEDAKLDAIKQSPVEVVTVSPDMEMKREKPTPFVHVASRLRRVRIVTEVASLRVRAKPNARSKVLAEIPKNTIVQVFQEAKDWFQVEYEKGKKGWVSKKFSKLVN